MKTHFLHSLITIFILWSFSLTAQTNHVKKISEFIKGADVSSLPQIEDNGGVFKENGIQKDALAILKDHGLNYIRLRIWHNPAGGYCGLTKTLQMAERIKNAGLSWCIGSAHLSE